MALYRKKSKRGGPPCPRELSRQIRLKGKALQFETIAWQDAHGTRRVWECVERTTGKPAVLIIPWLMPSRRLLLIRQYRPPAGRAVIEFPAGLIDTRQSVKATALRELHEETGYRGRILGMMPPSYNSPGLSGETVYTILVEIDETLPGNQNPTPHPEGSESIETILVPEKGMARFLRKELRAGHRFDSKVMAYFLGRLGEGADVEILGAGGGSAPHLPAVARVVSTRRGGPASGRCGLPRIRR
jgi:8-oxo-dGTP pyrophosphatase MutT (NUDIX family)